MYGSIYKNSHQGWYTLHRYDRYNTKRCSFAVSVMPFDFALNGSDGKPSVASNDSNESMAQMFGVKIKRSHKKSLSEVGFEPTPTRVDCDLNAAP
jgi:hypothetical protein